MSTFTDDFSSGSLAGYTGVVDLVTTPTGGPSGGTGIVATGTASQQYYGELAKAFPTAGRRGRAAFTFDCAAATFSTAGNYNVDVRTAAAGSSILYATQSGTSPYTLDIYNTFPPGGSATPALSLPAVLTGGTFTRVELRFQLSTEVLGALLSDGWWRVLVDGVDVGGETNVQIGVLGAGWGGVGFSPMGAGSDVLISDEIPGSSMLSTILPGPLTGDLSFLIMPDGDPAMGSNPTYLVAAKASTEGSSQSTVAVTRIVAATASPTVAACVKAAGGWWQATDNAGTGHTDLVEFDGDGTILRTVAMSVLIGNGDNGRHDLLELPSGDLLSVNRGTGALIRIAAADGTVAQTYGLTISPLDAAVNNTGGRLLYLDTVDVNAWDLENDLDLGTVFTAGATLRCLVWLADCSIAVTTADYLADGPGRRYSLTGDLLNSYAYDPTPFAEGQYVIYANTAENRFLVIGDWDLGESSEQPGVLAFDLSSGAQLGPLIPLVGELTDYDVVTAVAQVPTAIMCDPFPPPPTTQTYPVRRLRRLKLAYDKNLLLTVDRIELKMQVGEGTVDVPNPQVMLRASKDGGRTWGNLRMCSGGRMGEYSQRVYWNRFGQGRDWVLEISMSDPSQWYLNELLVDVTEGTS